MPRVQDRSAHFIDVPSLQGVVSVLPKTIRQAQAPLWRCPPALARAALLLLLALGEGCAH